LFRFWFSGSAQAVNHNNDGESDEDQAGDKTAPDESVNHVFGFHIHRAPRTAARVLLEHFVTISTGFCAHFHWATPKLIIWKITR